jgi:hypothetical protein
MLWNGNQARSLKHASLELILRHRGAVLESSIRWLQRKSRVGIDQMNGPIASGRRYHPRICDAAPVKPIACHACVEELASGVRRNAPPSLVPVRSSAKPLPTDRSQNCYVTEGGAFPDLSLTHISFESESLVQSRL